MTDNSVFPLSSQLKRLPDFKKGSVVLIERCSTAISSSVASVKFLIFQDLAHRDVSSRLLSNLSNKVILGRHLPLFLSPLQWHNAENFYGFVFTCGHFVFFVFKVYLDQVKNLIGNFFFVGPASFIIPAVYCLFISLSTYVICLSEKNVGSSLD